MVELNNKYQIGVRKFGINWLGAYSLYTKETLRFLNVFGKAKNTSRPGGPQKNNVLTVCNNDPSHCAAGSGFSLCFLGNLPGDSAVFIVW